MSTGDVNQIIRAYLVAQVTITAKVSTRVYCPRLPEGAALPAIGFFVRGGPSFYTKEIQVPSVQFDCWGTSPIEAREVYLVLFDTLHGIGGAYAQYTPVSVGGSTYNILAAREEVMGQDIQEVETPGYHRVLAFFRVKIGIQ